MNNISQQGLHIARLASRRIATNTAGQSRNMATRKDGFVPWLMTEVTQDHCWPFLGKKHPLIGRDSQEERLLILELMFRLSCSVALFFLFGNMI